MKQFASFRLDTQNECLWRDGAQIPLPPRPFHVLRYLVENPGRLITHDELLDALWPETYVQPQVLRTYVLELRKLLGDDAGQPRFIQTLTKRGYRFVAHVEEGLPEPPAVAGCADEAVTGTGLVGRSVELARLRAARERAASGQRQMVIVTGEAGIGKTALVDAFCRGLEAECRVLVARGQCVEGVGEKEEYYPLMEALGSLCARPEGEAATQVLARVAPAWLAALGRPTAMHAAPLLAPERKPGDLCAALEAISAAQPLLLIVEDMQWADESTRHLVAALARRRATARIIVVATCGPGCANRFEAGDPATGEHPLKALQQDLLMRGLATEIALAPLSQTAVSALLRQTLREETLPPGLIGFIQQRSEGNPLFALVLVEHLMTRRFLVRGAGGWRLQGSLEEMDAEMPDRLAQMIELELERLTPEEQQILGAGSVMGIAFPVWAAAAALGADAARVDEACASLARRVHFVHRAGEDELPDGTRSEFYLFVHGLYREVLYHRQASMRRAQWHMRIAAHLAKLFDGREATVARELAMHYEGAGEWRRASDALRIAARHARERRAEAEAQHLVERALRLAGNLDGAERNALTASIHEEFMQVQSAGAGAIRETDLTVFGRDLDDFIPGDG